MVKRRSKLTHMERIFVAEYLIDKNATRAAEAAGSTAKNFGQAGYDLLKKPDVRAEVDRRLEAMAKKLEVDADRVLQGIAQIAFGDIRGMFDADGRLKRPEEWDDDTAAAVAGLEVVTVSAGEGVVEHVAKIKRADRLRAMDMLARHLALYNDKLDVNVKDALGERLQRAKERMKR